MELAEQISRYADSLRRDLNVYLEMAADTEYSQARRISAERSAAHLEDALVGLHIYTLGAFGTSRDELREAHPDPYSVTA